MLSNSVLVVTPTSNPDEVAIRGQLHEILEPVPCLPKLQKLGSLLRGREYDEGHEDEELDDAEEYRPVSVCLSIEYVSHELYRSRKHVSRMTMREKCCKQAITSWRKV